MRKLFFALINPIRKSYCVFQLIFNLSIPILLFWTLEKQLGFLSTFLFILIIVSRVLIVILD
jgi:hypothetical protein